MRNLDYLALYPGALIASFSVLALMARRRLPRGWSLAVAGLGVVLVAARLVAYWQVPATDAHDLQIFWEGGRDALAGRDPYAEAPGKMMPIVNPPTAVPIFAAMAALPMPLMATVWRGVISLATLALVPIAIAALRAQGQGRSGGGGVDDPTSLDPPPLDRAEAGCLMASLALCDAATADLQLGQLAALTALALTVAVLAQGRGRPILAGVCLALATVKVGTMLPVLLLFLRRSDLKTWVALAVTSAALCLIPGHPAELPGRIGEMLSTIRGLSAPGQPNDITLQGPQASSIVGFEHAFYRLGLRAPGRASLAQFAGLAALSVALAWVVIRRKVPRPAACALVMLFALIFLYHRLYDALVLALPLAYAVSLGRSARGWRRVSAVVSSLAMLSILYMRRKPLQAVSDWSVDHGVAGRLAQAIVLPYATWAVLLAIACLYAASRVKVGRGVGVD